MSDAWDYGGHSPTRRSQRETHMLHERHVCHAPGLALLAIVPLGALVALLNPRRQCELVGLVLARVHATRMSDTLMS